ncbi:MAG: hypothetical protein IJO03_03385 [Clostridia bacterium]|nr:hypothetical protein [Clostridia bacterium]
METTKIIETTAPVAENVDAVLLSADDAAAEIAETTAVVETTRDYWTPENLVGDKGTVPIMGKGMLGIFIVMGIIILCVTLLNHFGSPERKQKKEAKKAAKAQANANQNK